MSIASDSRYDVTLPGGYILCAPGGGRAKAAFAKLAGRLMAQPGDGAGARAPGPDEMARRKAKALFRLNQIIPAKSYLILAPMKINQIVRQ